MRESRKLFEEMKRRRLIALLKPISPEACVRAYEVCEREEVILEIAFRTPSAEAGLRAVRSAYPSALVLAGTVMTAAQARAAIEAGAAGVVSPDFFPEVAAACLESGVMAVPGGLSDAGKQLAHKAGLCGCTLEELRKNFPEQWIYKLFPAFSEGASRVGLAAAWRGPFPRLAVVHTGGIDRITLPAALLADPEGIFCGSALARNPDEPDKMREEIRIWKGILQGGRAEALESQIGKIRVPGTTLPAESREKDPSDLSPGRIVCFGELMMRLSPPVGERLGRARALALEFGGAEANVAVSLAHFGREAVFVSALPDNDLGNNGLSVLRGHGVRTEFIVRGSGRMGAYFLEPGAGPRPSRVIYDRESSVVSKLRPADINWDRVLEGADWFHWTGITPALSGSLADTLRAGLEAARAREVFVSVDLNYRKKLWREARARDVMSGLMPYVDLCIGNEEDPARIFGLRPQGSDAARGRLDIDGFRALAIKLQEEFGFRKVALTLRESLSASENMWSACLLSEGKFHHSTRYRVWILDRLGSGDAFAAGLIHAMLEGRPDRDALEFAVAASVLKHSLKGDFNLVSAAEVDRAAAGETAGRIRR